MFTKISANKIGFTSKNVVSDDLDLGSKFKDQLNIDKVEFKFEEKYQKALDKTNIFWKSDFNLNSLIQSGPNIFNQSTNCFMGIPLRTYDPTITSFVIETFKETVSLEDMEYDSDSAIQDVYSGNTYIQGTGGTISYSGGYVIHRFTSSGTFVPPPGITSVETLIVAGGGGAGQNGGGGGGAGGTVYNTSVTVTPTTNYPIVVGGGGAGAASSNVSGTNGGNSTAFSLTAIGGGGGGSRDGNPSPGRNGGSGGGGAGEYVVGNRVPGTGSQGRNGGYGTTDGATTSAGGGGGGRSGLGGAGATRVGGNGGAGTAYTITGSSVYYAGGGGGGTTGAYTVGTGGVGGGGTNSNGVANTGGGGGAGTGHTVRNGGSGVVIVRYVGEVAAKPISENSIKTRGSYALKYEAGINYVGYNFSRSFSTPLNLSGCSKIYIDLRTSRTGANIKFGIHDSGGTITQYTTPTIITADTWQTIEWDISGVTTTNKDVIDQFIITIVNADAANTIYIDNIRTDEPVILDSATISWSTNFPTDMKYGRFYPAWQSVYSPDQKFSFIDSDLETYYLCIQNITASNLLYRAIITINGNNAYSKRMAINAGETGYIPFIKQYDYQAVYSTAIPNGVTDYNLIGDGTILVSTMYTSPTLAIKVKNTTASPIEFFTTTKFGDIWCKTPMITCPATNSTIVGIIDGDWGFTDDKKLINATNSSELIIPIPIISSDTTNQFEFTDVEIVYVKNSTGGIFDYSISSIVSTVNTYNLLTSVGVTKISGLEANTPHNLTINNISGNIQITAIEIIRRRKAIYDTIIMEAHQDIGIAEDLTNFKYAGQTKITPESEPLLNSSDQLFIDSDYKWLSSSFTQEFDDRNNFFQKYPIVNLDIFAGVTTGSVYFDRYRDTQTKRTTLINNYVNTLTIENDSKAQLIFNGTTINPIQLLNIRIPKIILKDKNCIDIFELYLLINAPKRYGKNLKDRLDILTTFKQIQTTKDILE
jgi:hypothetical protein